MNNSPSSFVCRLPPLYCKPWSKCHWHPKTRYPLSTRERCVDTVSDTMTDPQKYPGGIGTLPPRKSREGGHLPYGLRCREELLPFAPISLSLAQTLPQSHHSSPWLFCASCMELTHCRHITVDYKESVDPPDVRFSSSILRRISPDTARQKQWHRAELLPVRCIAGIAKHSTRCRGFNPLWWTYLSNTFTQ